MRESHENLSTTIEVLKKETKEKEDKYIKEIVDLEKKKKALDNIVYKMGQPVQTMHMLTKPQVFYDENHKTALGYQNPLYLTQAQRKKLALYCGHTIVRKHDPLSMIDSDEPLDLAEATRLKMNEKQNDLIMKEKRVNIKPINYGSLNELYKHFVPQKQLSAEQAFWLPISNTISKQTPVQPKPIQITKVTGQNEWIWGFEHIRKAFKKVVIPFVTSLRESFTTFDQGLFKEINEIKAVFNQTETEVEQCSMDRKCVEIEKKELLIENDRLLEQIIFLDIMCTALHAVVENKCVLPANEETLKYEEWNKVTLMSTVEQARDLKPLDNALDYACKFTT
ncbi:hypothetical protein Tco_1299736 [Tanacetum coccineum]